MVQPNIQKTLNNSKYYNDIEYTKQMYGRVRLLVPPLHFVCTY